MATKYQNFITGDDAHLAIWESDYWGAQTFTTATAHTITSVKLLLYRVLEPGTVTVAIRATSGTPAYPSGSDLCSGTTDGDTLPTASPYQWREITFGTGTDLAASTKYAIVVRVGADADVNNYVGWRADTANGYANGNEVYSTDNGVNWSAHANYDLLFEEWGDATALSVTAQPLTDITESTATGNGTIVSIGLSSVTQHGHCWATTIDPTTSDDKTSNGAGSVGTFTSSITGLTPGQGYFVRAYATNTEGTAYSGNISFTSGHSGTQLILGNIAVVQTRLHYVDTDGKERYLEGTLA